MTVIAITLIDLYAALVADHAECERAARLLGNAIAGRVHDHLVTLRVK